MTRDEVAAELSQLGAEPPTMRDLGLSPLSLEDCETYDALLRDRGRRTNNLVSTLAELDVGEGAAEAARDERPPWLDDAPLPDLTGAEDGGPSPETARAVPDPHDVGPMVDVPEGQPAPAVWRPDVPTLVRRVRRRARAHRRARADRSAGRDPYGRP
jgi:hypothetical protein